jgi:pimeloyl-ACP methyl ester carboxylesterase
MNEKKIATKYGEIALLTAGESSPALLLVHGNSASKEVWRKQLESDLAADFRLIAMDLPGHGGSSDAPDPEAGYCMARYAETAIAVLNGLKIDRAMVVGWSLCGHVAIEMLPHSSGLAGIVLTGTPPVRRANMDDITAGFNMNETTAIAGQEVWSAEEAARFSGSALEPDQQVADWVLAGAMRTDGRARRMMFEAFVAGQGGDQAEIVAQAQVLTALINGAGDSFVNNDYITAASYGNLWRSRACLMEGLGHAPFWQAPDKYNALLREFAADLQW